MRKAAQSATLADIPSADMAVYTKTGDKGKTGTFSGRRVSKSSQLIRTIGAIDELNSFLGIVGGQTEVQRNLFTINAILTGAKLKLPEDATKKLEREIDKIEGVLPVQKNFLVYGGNKKAAQLYFARALARKAERELVELGFRPEALIYLNRLSDYLFMSARKINHKNRIKEPDWKPKED
ncbi:MAG TPA: cob(I)yrinic acid a,c-diamide adenosyltransferase [Patescibacteria group bacterium]|nr:cob(I)yrinic acid a,c-diamide adenosyltransferase [Patescibacteria group bacterium]